MTTVTKQYRDLPAAHRQPNHDGHCRLIHGHNWGFDITFTASIMDRNGFVIDVGKLGCVKTFIYNTFDHTLLLNADDSALPWMLETLDNDGRAKIVVVPNCGMEGLAKWVYEQVSEMIGDDAKLLYDRDAKGQKRGLKVVRVVCYEDSKNSAVYEPNSL